MLLFPTHLCVKKRAYSVLGAPSNTNILILSHRAGVVSFMVGIGAIVHQGQPLFQICDPVSDKLTTVCSPADGCMYAITTFPECFFCNNLSMYNRERLRFAQPGLWICKVVCWRVA